MQMDRKIFIIWHLYLRACQCLLTFNTKQTMHDSCTANCYSKLFKTTLWWICCACSTNKKEMRWKNRIYGCCCWIGLVPDCCNVHDETGKIGNTLTKKRRKTAMQCIFYAEFHVYSKDIHFIVSNIADARSGAVFDTHPQLFTCFRLFGSFVYIFNCASSVIVQYLYSFFLSRGSRLSFWIIQNTLYIYL